MKQFLIIFSLVVISSLAVIAFHMISPQASSPVLRKPVLVSASPSYSPSVSTVGNPMDLQIPSLGVDASIEKVGLDSQDRMDVPKAVSDVGWYDLGYKPGEKGNAVIDGHYDKVDGSPAVFYRVSSLLQGDDLVVKDDKGNTYDFKVSKVTNYPYNQLPLQDIFAGHSSSQLILITCSGVWDQGTHNYSTRTVVYAQKQ